MKKNVLLFVFIFILLGITNKVLGQDKKETIPNVYVENGEIFAKSVERYKLYSTTNIYNFLILDTETGIVTGLQWSFDFDSRFTYPINNEELIYSWDERVNNRFELYPTTNHYTFILLDKINGRTWQVHWGLKKENIGIYRIY